MWSGLAGTVAIHLAAIAAILFTIPGPARPLPPTYAVELVAAPAAPANAAPAGPVVERPPVAAPKPVVKAPAKKPVVKPAPARSTVPSSKAAPKTAAPVAPLPGETPGTGSDLANVRLEGKEFPYPEYLRNLVTQIYRRWSRPVGDAALSAEVAFVILRDGSVKDIKIITRSRSYAFDLEAQGAIEQAARANAFGPLPAGYPADYLPIGFRFTPRTAP